MQTVKECTSKQPIDYCLSSYRNERKTVSHIGIANGVDVAMEPFRYNWSPLTFVYLASKKNFVHFIA